MVIFAFEQTLLGMFPLRRYLAIEAGLQQWADGLARQGLLSTSDNIGLEEVEEYLAFRR
jgi:hypothetical protein